MQKLIYSIKKYLLTIFGDIKIFRWPMFCVYHPTSFAVKGRHTRVIMNILQPGDVVMRSYNDYLDGYFIPKGKSGCSHSGLYIGKNQIVHSIAEGSVIDDIIDYCRTDRIMILRPASGQEWAIEHAKKCADENVEYDFNFEPGPGKYYCHEFTASCYPNLEIKQV
ncbi:MAG: YiiX/YebB-like N1pC/P60 family cysteine hydrolase, partial [Candidatus Riflebacteria bacterium]